MGRILVRLDLLPSLRGILWVPHRHMYESIFDKCTLIRGDHLIKATCQSVCKHFSHQLSKAVNEANGSEILHLISLCLLWD